MRTGQLFGSSKRKNNAQKDLYYGKDTFLTRTVCNKQHGSPLKPPSKGTDSHKDVPLMSRVDSICEVIPLNECCLSRVLDERLVACASFGEAAGLLGHKPAALKLWKGKGRVKLDFTIGAKQTAHAVKKQHKPKPRLLPPSSTYGLAHRRLKLKAARCSVKQDPRASWHQYIHVATGAHVLRSFLRRR